MADRETMGERIRRGLEMKNLSQSDLARLMDIDRQTVSQWVRDASEPRPGNLLTLAEILFDGDVHYLVHGPAREPEGGFPAVARPSSREAGSGFIPRRRKT